MVGGVHYRHPGLWIKAATTLDVLSGGRAWLGIGAAWNEVESRALGLPVPAARRALRDARGHAPDRPRDVAGRARQRGGLRRPPRPSASPAQLAPVALPAASADHDRRRRRAEDAPPRRPVRRRDERLRRGPRDRTTSTRSCAGTASGSAAPYDEIERSTLQGVEHQLRWRPRDGDAGPDRRPLRRARRRRRPAHHLQRPQGRRGHRRSSSSSGATSSPSCAPCDQLPSPARILPGSIGTVLGLTSR